MTPTLAQRLDALLPQTQCTRCGYDGCRPYAEAMAQASAQPNRCPPGGDAVIAALAGALGVAPRVLDAEVGPATPPLVARIDEDACIGCTKCIQACPVDAIVGASKLMHTVIAAWCTGCELCVPPCPVDCIEIAAVPALPPADASRARHEARARRHERVQREHAERLAAYE
ncbi:MAG TPA: RnfABCDGE type electron transport complex subunit B [Usitatibacter sp.]|jgi:electron transport complex protein RnfB|nr:RnfABCDGE type electron transport complex subunit B [Usitatibacter sp.]